MIIADPGSCHLGRKNLAKELIRVAKECGADAIKFQLFKDSPPNIPLPYYWVEELKAYADDLKIELFASVWDTEGIDTIHKAKCKSVKFSYSQRHNTNLIKYSIGDPVKFENHYVSHGIMDTDALWGAIELYCIPLYPVSYVIDFERIFPRFYGFSSHCLGINQDVTAVCAGAKVIEKHIRLDNIECGGVPDGAFALKPKDFYRLCKTVKDIMV